MKKQARRLIDRLGMQEVKTIDTPFRQGSDLSRHPEEATPLEGNDVNVYQSIVGALLLLGQVTRCDLCNSVCMLKKAVSAPMDEHLTAAKKAVTYLKGKEIRSSSAEKGKLTAYIRRDF